ncbi:uncharacterized protein LOC100678400 [Nasonia vitripennis]|uniref:Uncharacterized protein n=1 Tax=Nasonia vitripennis TaxID=7425 RepID=A0A7M7IP25_NASVI|nr:uncharacterized protein LOC100678400 [Nasonia vitripennis]
MSYTMLLHRSAILLCCAILTINQQVGAVEVATFTRQWSTNFTYKPEVVQVQDDVYLVSLQNYTVNITSINSSIPSLACKVPVNSEKTISSKITPVALGNGKILIRGSMTTTKIDNPNKVRPVDQLFVIVDPRDCSTIKIVAQFPSHPRYFEAVVPYENTFDLFYSNSSNKTEDTTTVPKRYDDNGEAIPLDYSLAPEKDIRGLVIHLLKPYHQSGGFFAAFVQDDGLVGLKLLDSHMKVLKESVSENAVDYISTLHDHVTYCYVTPSLLRRHNAVRRQQIFCELLNSDLKPKATIKLYDPEGVYVVDAEVVNLPDGGAVVVLAHKHKNPQSEQNEQPVDFYLQRINPDGTTREAVKIGTYPTYYFMMRGVLHRNSEFCLVVVGESQPRSTSTMDLNFSVDVKCVDTTK